METKGFHRKLTAILSADVAGYSRLMQHDEAATVKTLKAYKQLISDLTQQHLCCGNPKDQAEFLTGFF